GTYSIGQVLQAGFTRTTPLDCLSTTLGGGQSQAAVFGNFSPTAGPGNIGASEVSPILPPGPILPNVGGQLAGVIGPVAASRDRHEPAAQPAIVAPAAPVGQVAAATGAPIRPPNTGSGGLKVD